MLVREVMHVGYAFSTRGWIGLNAFEASPSKRSLHDATLDFMGNAFHAEARLRVRYAETDQMGVVYHANYLVWFEVGRVELLRSMGLEYRRLEQEFDCMIAVVGVEVRYRSPARYDDEIRVRTGIAALRGSVLKMRYEVVREKDGKVLCEGTTTHVVVDRSLVNRVLPEAYEAAFRRLLDACVDTTER